MYIILIIAMCLLCKVAYERGVSDGIKQHRILRDQNERENIIRELESYEKLIAGLVSSFPRNKEYTDGAIEVFMQERFRLLTALKAME